MKILVTRPEPDAARTAARLEALGHETAIASILVAEFLPPPAGLVRPRTILLTSGNATRGVARWPEIADWADIPVLCVGEHTAALALEAGFSDVRSADGDVEDLTALVMAIRRPEDGPLLYLTTDARSGRLAEDLTAAGYPIEVVESYRMQPLAALPDSVVGDIRSGTLDGVLLYSQRTAAIFRALVDQHELAPFMSAVRLFAISDKAASPFDFGRISVAAEPTEDSLLALLPNPTGTSDAGIR
ncbi:uroporphyrinogen-III synthase [Kaistia dalseonensis]|uniref:Uroporphyrinogen-III synthase n=1 Tax=Kaistia dalseonensis TaxID=410840 RepID=A0ABU0H4R0_9HYPH|nr:uroporphyrinogen-III synthase [Kaistia dalseonensis]MCX5494715.1 uroporphyrinogen-III synthase [Kaistia dalseonensis]MDQ0437296.1 uroporphyrinogen-III synthase [Kaistia dalseonensis]